MSNALGPESPFEFKELFFSRTNKTGIIESGNSVFQRVSKYEWSDLLGSPHNLIRHPNMPRGVFHLLWETILAGNPIGAYVVNQARDRSHYWVFALVWPLDAGFLSIRLKPSSPIFKIVREKYSELLVTEKSRRLTPKESQAVLMTEIAGLNFQSYRHFMNEALTQEFEYRQKSIGAAPIKVVSRLRELLKQGSALKSRCEELCSDFSKNSLIPVNLQIQAAKMGSNGASISIISSQYEGITKEINDALQTFLEAGHLVQDKVSDCQFNVSSSLLLREMFEYFGNEIQSTPVKRDLEMKCLETISQNGIKNAKSSLNDVDSEFRRFKAVYEKLRKLSSALGILSISGKIEAAKIKQTTGDLSNLLEDLAHFRQTVNRSLKEIDEIGRELVKLTQEMTVALG